MATTNDFDDTFAALKKVLKPYERRLVVESDNEKSYCLVTKHIMKSKQPLWFAGVRKNKGYVSYHLIPIYVCPELRDGLSADLKKRMQGKGCFNFKKKSTPSFSRSWANSPKLECRNSATLSSSARSPPVEGYG